MSGLFDLDTEGAAALEEEARLNPLDVSQLPPSTWQGAGAAFKGLLRPSAAAGRTLATVGAVPMIAEDRIWSFVLNKPVTDKQDWWFKNVVEDIGSTAVDYWTPNPQDMGSAAKTINMVGNVAGSIPQMIGAPGLFLGQSAFDPGTEVIRQGGDADTALGVAGVNLAANALGMRLPAAFGTTLTSRVATGAGANVAIGAAADAASSEILEAGGQKQQAESYSATDPYARGLDLLMGAAFGWKAHIDAPKVLTPSQRDAVLVVNNNDHLTRRTLPGEPTTPKAQRDSVKATSAAIEQLLAGEPVDVSATVRAEDFMLRPELQPAGERVLSSAREAVQKDFRTIAEKHGATITSMERPVIARGAGARSQHPHGTAADFRTRDKTPEQVEALMADLRAAGFEVVDERNTDQPHIHAELPPGGRRAKNIANAEKETTDAGRALRERLVTDPEQLARDYAALEDSKGGTVLNTDTARELAPEYLADRTRSADVHEAASDTIKTIYEAKLAQPTPEGFDRTVMFTAGGTGAGKTTAIRDAGNYGKPEIVYDTNMNTLSSAVDKVEQALAAGRDVRILYVYRDPVEALTAGAIPRAQRQAEEFGTGRTVPLGEHAKTHTGVRPVMEALAEKYRDDPRVDIGAIDNSHGKGQARPAELETLPKVEEDSLRERLQEALDQARTAGLAEDLYRGFSAEGRGQAEALGAGAGGQLEPQRGQVSATETPLDAAKQLAAETPDAQVIDGFDADGNPRYRPLAEALAEIEAERQQAATDANAFPAAVNCFLRRGGDAS
jgi:hypothetical protein